MSKKTIFQNSEGYYDGTAGQAISNLIKEGKAMLNGSRPNEGEIWRVEKMNGDEMEVFVLKCYSTYATTFQLNENEPRENGFQIKAQALMWIDLGKPGFVFLDKLVSFVKQVPDTELKRFQLKFAETVDISRIEVKSVNRQAIEKVQEEPKLKAKPEVKEEIKATVNDRFEIEKLKNMVRDMELNKAKVEAQRDVYKELYVQLLGDIELKGGCTAHGSI